MENKNISQIAFERIRGEGIKPIPRKVFNIKRALFWLVVILSLFIGAFTFSIILSAFFNNDWDLYNKFGFDFILKTVPYFWLVSLGVFTMLGEYYYRKTPLGYRRGFIMIIGIYMGSTIIFGTIFYSIDIDEYIEDYIVDNVPSYSNFIFDKYEVWSHPEDGLLSGTITKIKDGEIEIIDFNGSVWTINTKDSFIRSKNLIEVGKNVKIVGENEANNVFNADEIRSWNVTSIKVR